jgi:hypothetical protein
MQLLLLHLILIRSDIHCGFLTFNYRHSIRSQLVIRLEGKVQPRYLGARFVLFLDTRTGDLRVKVIKTLSGDSLISCTLPAEVVG